MGAIDKVVMKYYDRNNKLTIKGLNPSSQNIVDRLAIYNNPNAKLSTH